MTLGLQVQTTTTRTQYIFKLPHLGDLYIYYSTSTTLLNQPVTLESPYQQFHNAIEYSIGSPRQYRWPFQYPPIAKHFGVEGQACSHFMGVNTFPTGDSIYAAKRNVVIKVLSTLFVIDGPVFGQCDRSPPHKEEVLVIAGVIKEGPLAMAGDYHRHPDR